jgi:CHAT domain-containing protein
VNDFSTALLMIKFYELFLGKAPGATESKMPPAQALRRSQLWLRDITQSELTDYIESHELLNKGLRQTKVRSLDQSIFAGLVRASVDGDVCPFADKPYHWASFIFVGA